MQSSSPISPSKPSFCTPPDYYWPFHNGFNNSLKDRRPPTDFVGPDQAPPYKYYRQSAHSPSVGTHLSHPHLHGSRHDPPYNASSDVSSYSSTAVNHRPMYSPHVHTGHLGTPFVDQSANSGALLSEVRRMSAQISALQEGQERLLTSLDKMEVRVNALENPPEDEIGAGSCARKTAAGSRSCANDHPSVKMSQRIRSPMISQLTYLYASLSSTHCSMTCVGWIRVVTRQSVAPKFVQ